MNIYYPQVEKRSQLSTYLLVVFVICTVLMLILSFNRFSENRWNMSSASSQVVSAESISIPVAIPAPVPPAEQIQVAAAPLPAGANPVPQAVPAPAPSVQ